MFILLWEGWALGLVLVATYAAYVAWGMMDTRLAEAAASSQGIETPLTFGAAIKATTLFLLAGLTSLISGYALAEAVQAALQWGFFYSDKTELEASYKKTGKQVGTDGTSFENDMLNHVITSVYTWVVLSGITSGGYYFAYQFIGLDDGFACDLQEGSVSAATYAGIAPILALQKDRASCLQTIDQVFDIEDLDSNGTISRCEDATLQHAFGATKEYAFKFSSPFTRGTFAKICYENFSA